MSVFFTRRGAPPSLGTKLGDLEVGTIVHIKENGVYQDYLIVNQGLPSSMYDSSCDGTWLLRKDIYSEQLWNGSQNNIYVYSSINTYLNGTFLNLFDSGFKEVIKQVKIPYINRTDLGGSVASGANGLSCKIFLLSGYELGWTASDHPYFLCDGAKLSYFSSGTSTAANNKRIANYNGSATYWWLRSPFADDDTQVWAVYIDGFYSGGECFYSFGVRPAFILPSDFTVDNNNNIF